MIIGITKCQINRSKNERRSVQPGIQLSQKPISVIHASTWALPKRIRTVARRAKLCHATKNRHFPWPRQVFLAICLQSTIVLSSSLRLREESHTLRPTGRIIFKNCTTLALPNTQIPLMFFRLPAPAADDFAVHPAQSCDAPAKILDWTGISLADATFNWEAATVGRNVAERGSARTADAPDGCLEIAPSGVFGGFGWLRPGEVEEEGRGARIWVGFLVGGLGAQAGYVVGRLFWVWMVLLGRGRKRQYRWYRIIEYSLAPVGVRAGGSMRTGFPRGGVDF